MNTTYKVNLKSQTYVFTQHLWALSFWLLGYFIARYTQPKDYPMGIGLTICFTVVILIPSTIIHFQYLYHNIHVTFDFNRLDKVIKIYKNGKENKYRFDQIKSVHLRLTPSMYRKLKGVLFPWERYHYAVFEIEGGERIVITCLLINDLREFFKTNYELPSRWEKTLFPLISM